MPMKSEEFSSSDTKTRRSSSRRLRSLMSRTKACQRPSARMFALTSTGRSVPSFRLSVHSRRYRPLRRQHRGAFRRQPRRVLGRE